MKIKAFTGASGSVVIGSGFHTLMLRSLDSIPLDMVVSLELETLQGDNVQIWDERTVKELVQTVGFQDTPLSTDGATQTFAFPISSGTYQLAEGDRFKLNITNGGLVEIEAYVFRVPLDAVNLYKIDRKVIQKDSLDETINVVPYESIHFALGFAQIKTLELTWENGAIIEYDREEIEHFMRDANPVMDASASFSNEPPLTLPLLGVNQIKIKKTQVSHINILLTDTL